MEKVYCVSAYRLNVRAAPKIYSEKNNRIDLLKRDEKVVILNEKNGWVEIEYKRRGWVNKKYLEAHN